LETISPKSFFDLWLYIIVWLIDVFLDWHFKVGLSNGRGFMRPRFSLTLSSKRYAVFVATSAAIFGLIWANRQIYLEFQSDSVRAVKMLRGEENVGSNRLQVPMLREGSFPKVAVQQKKYGKSC